MNMIPKTIVLRKLVDLIPDEVGFAIMIVDRLSTEVEPPCRVTICVSFTQVLMVSLLVSVAVALQSVLA